MTKFGFLEKADRSQELGEKRAKKKILDLLKLLGEKKDFMETMETFQREICRPPFVVSRNTKFFYYYLASELGSLLVNLTDRLNELHNLDDIDRQYIDSVFVPREEK